VEAEKVQPQTLLVVAAVFAVVLLVAIAPVVAPFSQSCTVCHAGPNPGSGFTFVMPHLVFSSPLTAPPNWTMEVTLTVHHPGHYQIKDMQASLAVSGGGALVYFEEDQKTLSPISSSGGRTSCGWTIITGNASGTVSLTARLNFTAHYDHAGNAQDNDGTFSLVSNREISVRHAGLFATEGVLMLGGEGPDSANFALISGTAVRNVTIRLSGNLRSSLDLAPEFLMNLSAGYRQDIRVEIEDASGPVNNGRIDITWENETGIRDGTFIVVSIMGARSVPAMPGSGPLRLTGRVTGMLCLGLLMASLVMGLVNMGGKRRVRIHCAISWFIIGLSLFHGLMLVWGPYSRIMWGNFLLLGYASAAVMGVSGVNGLLQRWMSRKAGYGTWIWMHRITIIVAVVLVTVHAMAIGTDFAFLRGFLGDA
jgi:hypothetical protein